MLACIGLVAGLLGGCAETPVQPPPTAISMAPPPTEFRQCVPYARYHAGIDLFGDAWTWWDAAAGRFARGSSPRPGSVLVLQRTDRLRHGHVAVVRDLVNGREIRVDHANWRSNPAERAEPVTGMGVLDISPRNDWTLVRFWNEDAAVWGRPYPAYGFIYPPPAGGATS